MPAPGAPAPSGLRDSRPPGRGRQAGGGRRAAAGGWGPAAGAGASLCVWSARRLAADAAAAAAAARAEQRRRAPGAPWIAPAHPDHHRTAAPTPAAAARCAGACRWAVWRVVRKFRAASRDLTAWRWLIGRTSCRDGICHRDLASHCGSAPPGLCSASISGARQHGPVNQAIGCPPRGRFCAGRAGSTPSPLEAVLQRASGSRQVPGRPQPQWAQGHAAARRQDAARPP